MSTDRRTSASTASAVGYLLLLLAFATLGLFVAALATGTASAAVLFGVGLIACLGGSVAGFRAASRRLSESGVFIEATSPVSIFSAPLRQQQVDTYLDSYRPHPRAAVVPIAAARGRDEHELLSA